MVRVGQKIGRAAEVPMQALDLTAPQFVLMTHLAQTEEMIQQDLADVQQVTKGNISQLISKLEEKQLVARNKEGRIVKVSLTRAGRQLIEGEQVQYNQFIGEHFDVLSMKEQRQLLQLLHKLDSSLT